jgi:hypothetical protein
VVAQVVAVQVVRNKFHYLQSKKIAAALMDLQTPVAAVAAVVTLFQVELVALAVQEL